MGNICEIFSKNKNKNININNDEIITSISSTYVIHNKVDICSSPNEQLPSYSELYSNYK